MNEEEKQAIDWLKNELDDEKKSCKNCNYSYKGVTGLYGNNEVEIALNLIEKQQKEIEFYKMQELEYIAGYEDGKSHKQTAVAIRNENAQYELIRRHIEELKEKNKKLQDKGKELIFEKQELTSALLDSIPEDKIKEKIEELKNRKIGASTGIYAVQVDILEELLGENEE